MAMKRGETGGKADPDGGSAGEASRPPASQMEHERSLNVRVEGKHPLELPSGIPAKRKA